MGKDIVKQLEKTYTKVSQKSHEVAEFYTNIIFGFSSCLTIKPHTIGEKGTRGGNAKNTRQFINEDTFGRGCSWYAVRFFVTDATVADCSIAEKLIAEFQAEYLLADRGYDTDAIIQLALQAGMTPVIPPKKNRKVLRNYDKDIYKVLKL